MSCNFDHQSHECKTRRWTEDKSEDDVISKSIATCLVDTETPAQGPASNHPRRHSYSHCRPTRYHGVMILATALIVSSIRCHDNFLLTWYNLDSKSSLALGRGDLPERALPRYPAYSVLRRPSLGGPNSYADGRRPRKHVKHHRLG